VTERRLKTLIVGCGHIAGGVGLPARDNEALSHVAAYAADGRFEITACVDPDMERRDRFTRDWEVGAAYPDLNTALADDRTYDVASICTPSDTHADALAQLLGSNVGLVLCEKPLTTSLQDTERMVGAYAQAGKPLAVALTRRWHRAVHQVTSELSDGTWGRVQSVHARYSRGIRNTGTHIIDLLLLLVGPMTVRYAGNPRHDYAPDDPTIDAILMTNDGAAVHLMGSDGREFSLLEMELVTEKGAITFEDWGTKVRRRPTVTYRYAPDTVTLDHGSWAEYGAGGSFEAMVDNVYRTALRGEALACDGSHAVAAERLIEALIETATRSETAA
jgi:predicted dehydrogenase